MNTGEEQKKAAKELQEALKTLEKALDGKKFFGGETLGYLDIIVGWIPYWFRMIEEVTGAIIVDDETLPLMNAWFDNFSAVEIVKNTLPPKDELYEFTRGRREEFLSGKLILN
ncbi:Glutathione transferase protein [Dioscorea alata]|uniref:Glutathione transferase protein n=1 Tax=Dioscorea alata TaxID=55571 RepID=A0ACB7U5F6_DIOAL|nr:Glutathione transferase protein [Dioscorea alata]